KRQYQDRRARGERKAAANAKRCGALIRKGCSARGEQQMANAATISAGTRGPAGGAPPLPASAARERGDPARVVALVAMCFGMFMAFLDIQVVSASLSEIQAGLAASADEVTWVQTSYLMAEVVAIPLSGFLSRALGTRIMFAGAAAGFTVASLMCGLT